MGEFDDIRPYRDDEAERVLTRLRHDRALLHAAAIFYAPRLARWMPWLANRASQRYIAHKTRNFRNVRDIQTWLSLQLGKVVRRTIDSLTVDGLTQIEPGEPYLYISNHRDIVMDSALLNYQLLAAGHDTVRTAVGDNLLSEPYAADLMRLNKSFVIKRSVTGAKALFQVLNLTSRYIRHSLEEGSSIWIAQREGRAKDGFDRTDPAVLKMLALAYRDDGNGFDEFLARVRLVPVSLSYELDPCDLHKAHELRQKADTGSYRKAPDEDLRSMVTGIMGYKGRVHLTIGAPVSGEFADTEALAAAVDRQIVGGLRLFPTHLDAARRLGMEIPDTGSEFACQPMSQTVMDAWQARLAACPAGDLKYLLAGYANVLRNQRELGIR